MIILVSFILIVAINTTRKSSKQLVVTPIHPIAVNRDEVIHKLSGAIQIPTISTDAGAVVPENFIKLHEYLKKSYPLLHKNLKLEEINHYSLLYEWKGRDPSLKPILIMAHQDVVPIATGTEKLWLHQPFSGDVADGFIWGRGSWDDKGNLLAMMEAIELMLKNNYTPKRTIYLASGHDEETGPSSGQKGAREIVKTLNDRGVKLSFVLDEGLLITHKIIKGLDTPLALIGIAEKGYLTLKLSTKAIPGHSSMPSSESAIGRLSRALSKIEKHPFKTTFSEVIKEMFETIAPEFIGLNRIALSNLWLFSPYIGHQFQAIPSSAAMIRTTTALTTFHSGNKENVLPGEAEAQVNFRILPGEQIKNVIAHTEKVINDKEVIISENPYPREPSRVSSTSALGYKIIEQTVREIFPGTLVAPGLMIAATDSHHYLSIADNVYRFTPVHATKEDLPRFHGTNERVSVDNYIEMIQFYYRLMSHLDF